MTLADSGLPPELTVAAVVERQGRFMLVEERIAGRLVLNQPAGHVEDGETLVAAVVREALEETTLDFIPEATVGAYLWRAEGGNKRYLRVAFAGRCTPHTAPRSLDDGIVRVLWLNRTELMAHSGQLRSPLVLRAVDDFERGTRLPVDLFEGLTLDQLALRAAVL